MSRTYKPGSPAHRVVYQIVRDHVETFRANRSYRRKEVDVRPVYPAAMHEAGRAGVVPIEAVIGRDGTVSSVRVLSAQVHPDFAIAAVDAVRPPPFQGLPA